MNFQNQWQIDFPQLYFGQPNWNFGRAVLQQTFEMFELFVLNGSLSLDGK